MSAPHVVYRPRKDVTPEGEIAALANIYTFVLRCGEARRAEEKKKGGPETAPDDARKESNHVSRKPSIPR